MQVREIAILMGSMWNYQILTARKILKIPIITRKITELAIFHKRGKSRNWTIFNAEFASVKRGLSVALHLYFDKHVYTCICTYICTDTHIYVLCIKSYTGRHYDWCWRYQKLWFPHHRTDNQLTPHLAGIYQLDRRHTAQLRSWNTGLVDTDLK